MVIYFPLKLTHNSVTFFSEHPSSILVLSETILTGLSYIYVFIYFSHYIYYCYNYFYTSALTLLYCAIHSRNSLSLIIYIKRGVTLLRSLELYKLLLDCYYFGNRRIFSIKVAIYILSQRQVYKSIYIAERA